MEAAPAAAGVAEGIGVGTVTSAAVTGSDFSLSFARKSEGKDHTPNVGKAGSVDRPTPKERIRRTPEDVKSHFKKLGKDEWKPEFKDGRKIYINKDTGEKRWGDFLHNEIECNKGNKSWVIDPITEKILDKKGHLFKEK